MKIALPQNKRTRLAVKNIGISIFIKGGSIFISFVLVPLTLGYLNPYEYGVWLTLNSVLSWVYMFDIGLGNGLRNKLTEALANQDYELGKIYVSTTFFFMFIIGGGFYGLFSIAQIFLNWHTILNVQPESIPNLNSIITVVFAFVSGNFIFKTIGVIYTSHQYPAANDFITFCGNLLSLIIIYILTKTTNGSLQWVAYSFSGIPVLVYIFVIPITFKIFPKIKPSISYIKFKYGKSLMGLGIKFFIIQIATVIVLMSSNILISKIFGPEEVTPYNIAFKLFSIVTFGFGILMSPLWAAVTDAMTRNDYGWIKNILKKFMLLWLLSIIGVIILIFISPYIYKIWLHSEVEVPMILSIFSGVYVTIMVGLSIFANIVNGFGKLRIQFIFSTIEAIIYIPLSIILSHYIGISGIIIALCITMSLGFFWAPYQTFRLLNRTATGIWNK